MDKTVRALVEAMLAVRDGKSVDVIAKELEEKLNTVEVKVYREDSSIPLPTYGKEGDACCDVYATKIEYEQDKDRFVIHTGLYFELPDNYEMELRPRSSNTKTEYYIPNSPMTLDSGYRGELLVIFKSRISDNILQCINYIGRGIGYMTNTNISVDLNVSEARFCYDKVATLNEFPYKEGDRVCQLLVRKREFIKWNEVLPIDLSSSERNNGGFGSTGK